jgi:hypothetical protein
MRNKKTVICVALFLALSTRLAFAEFHFWTINEVFSDADGTVQFIELTTTVDGQNALNGHSLVSIDTNQNQKTLNFLTDLSGTTSNRSVLIATEEFTTLTGLSADYIIESNFIPISGGSLNFGEGTSLFDFTQPMLPLNGEQSIDGNAQPQTATPTNFSGLSAMLAVDSYASFDVGSSVMQLPVADIPGIGIANLSFTVDLGSIEFTLNNDFYLYAAGIVGGDNPAQLQNNSTLYIPGLVVGEDLFEFNMDLLGDDPVVFGNLVVLSTTNLAPTPEPEPEPEPDNSAAELQASISRGQSQYASLCAVCHGPTGSGGSGPNLRISSFNTFALLQSKINSTMPQNNPAACVDDVSFTCATDIANFVLDEFQN